MGALLGSCAETTIEESSGLTEPETPQDNRNDTTDRAGPTSPFSNLPVDDPTCSSASPDVTVSGGGWWSAAASLPVFDELEFVVIARPGEPNLNGLVAIGAQELTDFPDAAILVRFAEDGLIDARDGSTFDKDETFGYEAGVWYTIVVSANLTTRTYDVDVGRCGDSRERLITGAAFRSDAPMSDQLSTWGAWSSDGSLELTTPTWVASGNCAPTTCESLAHVCGEASDGCGGNLSCGRCESSEVCVSGTCVELQ
jgi:hypothetical protein